MKLLNLSLALGLTACAISSETPTTYERGTLTRPPAPARPGVGAPTYDPHVTPLPPHPGPDIQPNPRHPGVHHTPKTRSEDTIWAIEKPSLGDRVFLLYEPIPAPTADDSRWANERTHIMQCGADMNQRVRRIRTEEWIAGLDEKIRACLAYILMEHCLNYRHSINQGLPMTKDRLPGAASAMALLRDGQTSACDGPYNGLAGREFDHLLRWGLYAR